MTATTDPKMMTAPHEGARDPFYLTGDSRADLDRMTNACAPAPQGPISQAVVAIRDQLGALRVIIGEPALYRVTHAVDDLHYAAVDYRDRTVHLEQITRRLDNRVGEVIDERDRARATACALEAELTLHRDPWVGRYLEALEAAVGDDARDRIVAAVNADVAANPPAPEPDPIVMLDSPGLPVVDDATLGEGELIFRRGDTTIAVGRLDRLFGPLDTATEIALGAAGVDAPDDAAHPLGED